MPSPALDALAAWMREEFAKGGIAGPKRKRGPAEEAAAAEEGFRLPELPGPLVRAVIIDWLADPEPTPRLLATVSKALGHIVAEELRAVAPNVEAAIASIFRKEELLRLWFSPLWKVPSAMGAEAFEAFWELEDKWFRAAKASVPPEERALEFDPWFSVLFTDKRRPYRDYRRTFLTWNVRVSKADETKKEEDERERLLWGAAGDPDAPEGWIVPGGRFSTSESMGPRSARVVNLRGPGLPTVERELIFAPDRRGSVEIWPMPHAGPPIETTEFVVGRGDVRPAEIEDGEQRTLGIYLGPTLSVLYDIALDMGSVLGREAMPCTDAYGIRAKDLEFGIPIWQVLEAAWEGKRTDLLPLDGPPGTKPATRSMKNALALVRIVSVERTQEDLGTHENKRIARASQRIEEVVGPPWNYDPVVAWAADVEEHVDESKSHKDRGGHLLLPLPLFLAALHQEDPRHAPPHLDENSALLLLPDADGWKWRDVLGGSDREISIRLRRAWRTYRMEWPQLHVLYFPRGEAYHRRLSPADAIYFPKYVEYDALKASGLVFQSSVQ